MILGPAPVSHERRARILQDIRARRTVMQTAGRIRRKRVPQQIPPSAIRVSYQQELVAMLRRLHEIVLKHLEPKLEAWLKAAHRHDAEEDDYGSGVDHALDDAQREFEFEYPKERRKRIARQTAERNSKHQKEQLGRQVRAVAGVDVVHAEPWLEAEIGAFVQENVSLITKVERDYLSRIEQDVIRSVRAGQRWEKFARQLQDDFDIAKGKARLIARDQTLKFHGDLNKRRQADLGIKKFVWRTSKDNRVRDSHAERDGETYTWEKGADVEETGGDSSFPARAINCRCSAEPDLDDLLENLGI